jgi:polyisoprenyl-phosphate glycosyltransferase
MLEAHSWAKLITNITTKMKSQQSENILKVKNKLNQKISIVIPVFNNELNLDDTVTAVIELSKAFKSKSYDFECIFVDDGSEDDSYEKLVTLYEQNKSLEPAILKIIKLTKNFGQYYAIEAGMSLATGDYIGFISADLQDPINLFLEMAEKINNDTKLVIAEREKREDAGFGKYFAKLTHYLIKKYINSDFPNGGYDFCLFDKCIAKRVVDTKDRNGELAILLLSFGYKHEVINYTRTKRVLGKSGWTLSKKIKLFIDTFTSNSYLPLRVVSITGALSASISALYFIFVFFQWMFGISDVQGWTTIVLLITLYSGLILLSIGIIGEYLWRILDGVKNNERYIVENKAGF